MLYELLQKAISLNADRLEIEYKDGEEWIIAFCGDMGLEIGSVDSTTRDKLFEELERFRKSKRVTLLGNVYRLDTYPRLLDALQCRARGRSSGIVHVHPGSLFINQRLTRSRLACPGRT